MDQFKKKVNDLVAKAASGKGDFAFPSNGEFEVAAWEPEGQWDVFFTFTPEGGDDERMIEVHMYPSKNPRDMYDRAKDEALKPDSWDKIVGWDEDPDGYPNRNEYDDIRLCGLEEKQPYHVRWVQQNSGSDGGYFVRLETTYMAPKDYLRDYADPVWNIVNQAGFFNPAQ